MRSLILALALTGAVAITAQPATSVVNLTPAPAAMTVQRGVLSFPSTFSISVDPRLNGAVTLEAERFADILGHTMTGRTVTVGSKGGLIQLSPDASLGDEAYRLRITARRITVSASSPRGFHYGLQTIRKMLPAHVVAGTRDASVTEYTLPCVTIDDAPRFAYRGFMLDVSRHFHPVSEIKRLLDIMATYKMNVFHWHLTDDQGWRAEIKAYPRLTTIGATAQNCRVTSLTDGTYWTNEPYGPYYYTQEEMREVVRYAAERHIDVMPEIDMPGHFVAALAAYPEFSCDPRAQHNVQTQGGVFEDVLNVGNPRAVQFAKDILAELCDIFPYPYIHIGGDECPTAAWEKNAACQALRDSLGATSYRQLQSHFIKDISDFVAERGKRLFVWNESVSCEGSDLDLVRSTDAVVMSWYPCQEGARQAAELGLQTVITEFHSPTGGYYINRKQSKDPSEPDAAGRGDDTVRGCYEYVPVPEDVPADLQKYYIGVQGTFWCEWVATSDYLEYLALPRLICMAEAGWSPQARKDWTDFKRRLTLDLPYLNLGGYTYSKHWMEE